MKFKSIITLCAFLFVAISCSMEDDVLNEVTKSPSDNNSNQTEVYLSVNAVANGVTTRAGSSDGPHDGPGDTFDYCTIFFCEGETILGIYDNVTKAAAPTKTFLAKKGRTYDILVIADANERNFQSLYAAGTLTAKSTILSYVLGADDLDSEVKFGQVSHTAGSKSTPTETVEVELKQLTAKVQLMEVKVNDFSNGTNVTAVSLTSVKLLNQNIQSVLTGTANFVRGNVSPVTDFSTEDGIQAFPIVWFEGGVRKDVVYPIDNTSPIASFPTFPTGADQKTWDNSIENQIALELSFQVGKNTTPLTRAFVINPPRVTNATKHDYVLPGNIYQLYVSINVEGDSFNCTIKCCTKDWIKNTYEEVMTEVK